MTGDLVRTEARAILRDHLGCDDEAITEDSTVESLGGDSLDVVELAMALEDHFEISIDEDGEIMELSTDTTFSGIVDLINSKKGG